MAATAFAPQSAAIASAPPPADVHSGWRAREGHDGRAQRDAGGLHSDRRAGLVATGRLVTATLVPALASALAQGEGEEGAPDHGQDEAAGHDDLVGHDTAPSGSIRRDVTSEVSPVAP
jgi:hypothetical protein